MPLKIIQETKPQKGISLIFFLFEGEDITKHPLFRHLDAGEADYLKSVRSHLAPKEKEAKVFVMPQGGKKGKIARKVVVVGLGKESVFTPWKAGLAMRLMAQTARKEKLERVAFWVGPMKSTSETKDFYEVIAANAIMANFEFVKYKTPPTDGFSFLKEIQMVALKKYPDITEGIRRGIVIGEETNACRELANTPGGDMTPEVLAAHAVRTARKVGVRAMVLNEKKMKSLKMGGVLGVGKGSDAPPRFIILEYMKGPKNQKPIVLVGKGVTFDTGGLNLKPEKSIYEMHMDMSGGAAVIHTLIAAARLKLKKNIVALVPAVENMPSGSSYRPGDLLRTMSGKTIEVLNTDAEGRVILADALHYAKKYKPSLVVDVATLTGAAMVALGLRYSALFTPERALEKKFKELGEEVGDRVWPLPLTAEYEDDIKGTFGDWANIGRSDRYGGAITAAVFLWQFTKEGGTGQAAAYPWVHLDIAPRMTAIEGEYLAKGAAGAPVRLLTRFLEE